MSVERALGYPYDIPTQSYLLRNGTAHVWDKNFPLSGRIPVLACGSNQSPTQLARKFPRGDVPVMAGWLDDYDSVYSAHFTTYGSIAATYHHAPGLRSRQMITWLDKDQLKTMHKTEALGVNYNFITFNDIVFTSDCAQKVTQAHAYQSIRGLLKINDLPVGLQAIDCRNASYLRLNQEALQNRIMTLFEYKGDLLKFVQQTIENKEERSDRTTRLVALSQP